MARVTVGWRSPGLASVARVPPTQENIMTRKIADCREMPSNSGCTLTITGEEDEVLAAATAHAVSGHGHTDDDALREGTRSMLRDSPQATAEGAFVQLIEFRTDRIDEFDAAADEWLFSLRCARTAPPG